MIVLLACLLCCATTAVAVPAKPGWHVVTQSDGTTLKVQIVGDEITGTVLTSDGLAVERGSDGDLYYFLSTTGLSDVRAHEVGQRTAREMAFIKEQQDNLKNVPAKKRSGMPRQNMFRVGGSNAEAGIPAQGVRRIPVILVEYEDIKFKNTREAIIQAMLTGSKSVGQYFRDQSNGLYQPEFDVYGIYTLSQKREYYGAHNGKQNDIRKREMVSEGIRLAAADGVSFRPYDTDDDNYCDVVIVLYAGIGEASASATHPESIWPSHGSLDSAFRPSPGDVYVHKFAVINELAGAYDNTTQIAGIGVFVHEFSHALGLPDFYDTNTDSTHVKQHGMGCYDIMGDGNWNHSGYTPAGYSAYEKVFMDWIEYVIPKQDTCYTLPVWNKGSATTDKAVYIESSLNPNEYFILENRRKQGWDEYIPDEGIMITHVTYDANRWTLNTVDTMEIQLMTIMSACSNFSDHVGDLWPNDDNNNHDFTNWSNPPAKLNMTANGTITGEAGYLNKPVTGMVINADSTASFWYSKQYSFSENGIYYRCTGENTVEVTYRDDIFNTYSSNVSIPSSVTHNGKAYSVTAIGSCAFQDCSYLSSVTIPNSVRSIGQYAFANCSRLTSITCLATNPPTMAFSNVFNNDTYSNATLKVPITSLSAYQTANYWKNFTHIQDDGSPFVVSGIYYKTTGGGNTVMVTRMVSGLYSGSVIIPNSVSYGGKTYQVTAIDDFTFYNCAGLTSVTLPNSVNEIGDYAFWGCTKLKSITCLATTPPHFGNIYGSEIQAPFSEDTYFIATLYVLRGCRNAYEAADWWKNFEFIEEKGYDFDVNDVYYTITGTNTVEVTYKYSDYNSYSGSVSIPSSVTYGGVTYTVTRIGVRAFSDCNNLTSVTIPSTVTSVGNYAFYDCSQLNSVTFPNSVTSIGTSVFKSCTALKSVSFGTSLASIGSDAFTNCPNLRSVTCRTQTPPSMGNFFVFHGNTYIGGTLYVPNSSISAYRETNYWSRFRDIRGLNGYDFASGGIYYTITGSSTVAVTYRTASYNSYSGNVSVPASVTYNGTTYQVTAIGARAFRGCTGLNSVTLPNTIIAIDAEAFYGCTTLELMKVPNSVVTIGPRAFYNCNQIQNLTLGSSLYIIGEDAFSECYNLKYVGCLATNPPSMDNLNVFDEDTYSYASLGVPKGRKSDYQNAYGWENFDEIQEMPYDFVVNGIYYTITGTNTVEVSTASGNTYSGSVTIPSSVTYGGKTYQVTGVGTGAFIGCQSLESVTIPNSVTYISYVAFALCPQLTMITIGSGVTSIGEKVFDESDALRTVICYAKVPPTITDDDVFQDETLSDGTLKVPKGCKSAYQAANVWKEFTTIQELSFKVNGIYYAITGSNTVEVTYPDEDCESYSGSIGIFETVTYNGVTYNVTAIGDRAFKYCWDLNQVNFFEDGVTAIGEEAFGYCMSLTEMELPSTVTTIGDRAFINCSEMTNLSLGNSVTYIGDGAFTWCDDLSSVTLPNTVTYLGAGAFNCCFNLSSVNIPEKITTIGDWTFADCYALTSLDIPNLVTSIGDDAFSNSALESITLSKNLQRIGKNAFEYCRDLKSVICLATTPPVIQSSTFVDSHYTTVTLTVPKEYRSAYKAVDYWKNFASINELPGLDNALNVTGGHIHFASEGSYPWEVTAGGGRIYAISGNAGVHSSTSTLSSTVTLSSDGTVTFAYKAWGEGSSYDVCEFLVDGNKKFSYGNKQNDWVNYTVHLTAGTHTLTWKYSKDSSVNPPGDYFAIDNVVVKVNAVPGDIDGDGEVGIADVADLVDLILSATATVQDYPAADVDGDGLITVADAADLLDIVLSN